MIKIIAEYFKTQPVMKAWLFGSFARGEEHPDSDVDLLVVIDHSRPVGLESSITHVLEGRGHTQSHTVRSWGRRKGDIADLGHCLCWGQGWGA